MKTWIKDWVGTWTDKKQITMTHFHYPSDRLINGKLHPHLITDLPQKPPLYFTHYTVNGKTAETANYAAQLYKEALEQALSNSKPFREDQVNNLFIQNWQLDGKPCGHDYTHDKIYSLPDIESETVIKMNESKCTWCKIDCLASLGKGYCHAPAEEVAILKPAVKEPGPSNSIAYIYKTLEDEGITVDQFLQWVKDKREPKEEKEESQEYLKREFAEVLRQGIKFSGQIGDYVINQSVFDWLFKKNNSHQTLKL